MSDTAQKTSLRDTFIQQKKKKSDKVLEEAQRLVNMYRQLDSFGPDFGARLDDLLRSIAPDVETALSDIQGGATVRRYCEFLKGNDAVKTDPSGDGTDSGEVKGAEGSENGWDGYLPSPEEDIPASGTATSSVPYSDSSAVSSNPGVTLEMVEALVKNMMDAHQTEMASLLKLQNDFMESIIQRLDKNTHDVATHQTDRLINALQQEAGKKKQYADVIESSTQQSVLVPEDMEGF